MQIERVTKEPEAVFALGRFLVSQIDQAPFAPIDEEAATNSVWNAVCEGMTWVAKIEEDIVGSLALRRIPLSWYTAPDRLCLVDEWFIVDPAHRFGQIGVALLRTARQLAEEVKAEHAFVRIVNPNRPPPKTEIGMQAIIAGWSPVGYVLQIR